MEHNGFLRKQQNKQTKLILKVQKKKKRRYIERV